MEKIMNQMHVSVKDNTISDISNGATTWAIQMVQFFGYVRIVGQQMAFFRTGT